MVRGGNDVNSGCRSAVQDRPGGWRGYDVLSEAAESRASKEGTRHCAGGRLCGDSRLRAGRLGGDSGDEGPEVTGVVHGTTQVW